jgi:FRG domain
MPPYTTLPRPEGHIYFDYSPISPANWDIVGSNIHIFVYRNVQLALQAMLQATTTIQAQRLEAGTASLYTDHLYFRGQPEVTWRLLPTRLRGRRREPMPRKRFRVDDPPKIVFGGQEFPAKAFRGPPGKDPRDHFGDWYEEAEPMRVIEESAEELTPEELGERDARARAALERAVQIPEVARLDEYQQRAVVRHYSRAPSTLLDVSTNPEVAAFFATGAGSQPPPAGQIGLLWAIDLNFLDRLLSFEIASVPNGLKIRAREERHKWGVNKQLFEQQRIQPTCIDLTFVVLPFRRPLAQYARFLSLSAEDGAPLPPLLTELTWWSIIERGGCACAFIHDGHTYENPSHNITRAALLPDDEELAIALA